MNRCFGCAHFKLHSHLTSLDYTTGRVTGECHRYPPVQPGEQQKAQWPVVSGSDSCGEFREATQVPPTVRLSEAGQATVPKCAIQQSILEQVGAAGTISRLDLVVDGDLTPNWFEALIDLVEQGLIQDAANPIAAGANVPSASTALFPIVTLEGQLS
jgi:hypothetical protein